VRSFAWSPDGRYFAFGRNDNSVQVWEVAGVVQVCAYRGHTDKVIALAWSPDGKRIASGSHDDTVQVWMVA
jgi:WD40 repeat protein